MEKMVISLADQKEIQVSAETIWVERLSSCLFQVMNLPALAYDIDLDDEVEATVGDDGRFVFVRVVSRSGNVAYRLFLLDGVDPLASDVAKALNGIRVLSSAEEKMSDRFYVFNMPPSADRKILIGRLDDGERSEFWNYESSSDDPYLSEGES